MTDNFKKLINKGIEEAKTETVDEKILSSYIELIDVVIKEFFKNKKYKLNDDVERTYKSDLYSILSIIEIQESMLNTGIDLMYSLYSMGGIDIVDFKNKYLEYSRLIDIYKLQIKKDEKIEKLNEINNIAKKCLNILLKK